MNHTFFVFQAPVSDPSRAAAGNLVVAGPNFRPNNEIGEPRLILDRREGNTFRRSWSLPQNHQSRHPQVSSIASLVELACRCHAHLVEVLTEKTERMRLE